MTMKVANSDMWRRWAGERSPPSISPLRVDLASNGLATNCNKVVPLLAYETTDRQTPSKRS